MTDEGLAESGSIDRRRFLGRAATVAWATPMILTMMSSRAGASLPGEVCGTAQNLQQACVVTTPCTSPAPLCKHDPLAFPPNPNPTRQCICSII